MIKALIFDMDGLMVDSEPIWREAEIAVFNEHGLSLTPAECKQTMGLRIDEVVHYWKAKTGLPFNSQKVEESIVEEMRQRLLNEAKPMPGFMELFDEAHGQNLKLSVASSSYPVLIKAVTERFQITHKLDAIVSASECEFGKPHPDVFLKTAKILNIAPIESLVFEDSLNGVIAGKSAQMSVIAVPDEEDFKKPQFSIADETIESLTSFKLSKWLIK
ncbi:MAG: hexitol phosphatase HxpB [Salibacter sp.]|uniref:hexitol phosphatase HxpB n=1 Tax=Salibacter sp. TaxID=2010995 RepID=UPI00287025B1|nr:hexitol phosphatase HxpB [Salibacter sp.]MDR9399230.1 hexitol phosphatase HxpB [Salibacter sp.]